ncbi:MAG TPA: ACP synthase [Polyangia bacterium]|nr:ACP synthase [Polyangia bacterium]
MNVEGHIGELDLRRRRAGEALGAEGPIIEAHAAACAECKARIRALDDEQRRFEAAISFDRFAAGVERAARGAPAAVRRRPPIRSWMVVPTLAMAAAVAVVVTFRGPSTRVHPPGYDGIKGGAGMIVRVAGAAGQRTARVDAVEALSPGERLRIGYQTGGHRYLLSLSIDEHGEVTPLYPEEGASLTVPAGVPSATHFLPDSLELTGTGLERIIVLLSDQPVDMQAARQAARAAYDRAGGDLGRLPRLDLPGEQFTRVFAKP